MKKVRTRRGNTLVLLNPAEKGAKYAYELKKNQKYTNDGKLKVDEKNKPQKLSKNERSWRAGYLSARSDNAKAFKAIQRKHKK